MNSKTCKITALCNQKGGESDALCREYGLSVIEDPERGKTKHYSEWDAERKGLPTQRSMVKADVDTAIRRSMTESQFYDKLRKLGYEIKPGRDISVKAFGRERFIRLERSFGDDYSIKGIRRRILIQTRPEVCRPYPEPKKAYKFNGVFHKPKRKEGLRALYFYYLYRMGAIPKGREPNPNQVYFLFREDIKYIRRISEETRLLVRHDIDTDVQLDAHRQELQNQINLLNNQRILLRNKLRSIKDVERLASMKSEISVLSKSMGSLRREVSQCDEIERRSLDIKEKILIEHKDRQEKKNECTVYKPVNRSAQNR